MAAILNSFILFMEVQSYLAEICERAVSFSYLGYIHSHMGLPQVNKKSCQELEYKTLLAMDV